MILLGWAFIKIGEKQVTEQIVKVVFFFYKYYFILYGFTPAPFLLKPMRKPFPFFCYTTIGGRFFS